MQRLGHNVINALVLSLVAGYTSDPDTQGLIGPRSQVLMLRQVCVVSYIRNFYTTWMYAFNINLSLIYLPWQRT